MLANKWETLKLEYQLVLHLIQLQHPDISMIRELLGMRLDWGEVLGILCFYRIAGVAYYTIQKCYPLPDKTNGDFLLSLETIFEAQKIRTQSMKRHIINLAKNLNSKQINYVFLKGSFLSSVIYPLGCRMSNDVDILVDSNDLSRCSNLLKELGFTQGFIHTGTIIEATRKEIVNQRLNYGEIVPFHKYAGEPGLNILSIDVNFSMDETALKTKDATAIFLQNKISYRINEFSDAVSLQIEYFLIHLCQHLFKEASVIDWIEWQRDLSLYKFLDIYCLVVNNENTIDWQRLAMIIQERGMEKACYFALYNTQLLFPFLNKHEKYCRVVKQIEPADRSYMDQVVNFQKKQHLVWKEDFLDRVFDLKRFNKLSE